MLENLLTQLKTLMKQSPQFDEEILRLLFDNDTTTSGDINHNNFKVNLAQFIKQKKIELSQHTNTLTQLAIGTNPAEEIPSSSIDSLQIVMSHLEQFVQLYSQTSAQLANDLTDVKSEQASLISTHKENLTHLYETIDIHYQLHSALNDLVNSLEKIDTTEQLLGNVEEVIALLLKSMLSEKDHSKLFVKDIHREIDDLKAINQQSDDIGRAGQQQHQHWDRSTQHNLGNLDKLSRRIKLSESDSKAVSNEITLMKDALSEKTDIDKKLFVLQQKQIDKLNKKLEQTEQEASTYHSQLIEQRLINMQDSLTKLPNRKALEQKFEAHFVSAKQSGQSLWVAVADIDNFKSINDNYGHSAGDKTLQVIAGALSNSIRDSEFIARYGGEEFVLLIPDLPQNAINTVLNRLRERIKSIPFKFKDKKVQITLSIGVTKVKVSDSDRQVSFDRADKALYQAKRQGRDRVIIY